MPELPEVETVARDLRRLLVGRRLIGLAVAWPKTVTISAVALQRRLRDAVVLAVRRRGKYIIVDLSTGDHLVIHLGMTGRIFLQPRHTMPEPHTRVTFTLDNGSDLCFVDPRAFGRVALFKDDDLEELDRRLGPEPLAKTTTALVLAKRLQRRTTKLKILLLDQGFLAGLGNIYADEALFLAGLHPERPANSLSDEEVHRLHEAIRTVLRQGIKRRGTTLDDEQFRSVEGQRGQNQEILTVFRRTGSPCPRCGAPIQRIRLGGRSTHFCPSCQT